MKIIVWLSPLIFVPAIVGTALALSGYSAGAWVLALGVPAVMIALVILGLVLFMKGKLFAKPSEDDESDGAVQSESEKEQAALNEINHSHYYKSQFKLAEYEATHIAEGMKNSSKKGVTAGILFFLTLVALAVLATVLLIKRIWIGAIVCAALFGATVITILITAIVVQNLSMRGNISRAKKFVCGQVKSCILSSMGTTKSVTPTVRVNSVVYRVVMNAGENVYVSYSKNFYEKDEKVVIAVMGKKRAKIIEESDLENQSEEIKNNYGKCLDTGETVVMKKVYTKTSAGPSRAHRRRR